MKKQLTILVALLVTTFALTAQNFEGIVKTKSTARQGINAEFTIKDDRVVMESTTGKGEMKVIFEGETGDMIMVTNQGGHVRAVKMNANNQSQMGQIHPNYTEKDANKYEVNVTKETKMIRGYECVKVTGKDEQSEGYAWVATDLDLDLIDLFPQAKRYIGNTHPMQTAMGVNGFIMKLWMKDAKTGEEWTLENEVIEQKVDAEIFELDPNIEVFDTSKMQELMKAAQSDPAKMQELQEMLKRMDNHKH